MFRRIYVLAHNRYSKAAKLLLSALLARTGARRGWVRETGQPYTTKMHRADSLVFAFPGAINKLDWFRLVAADTRMVAGVDFPMFTTNQGEAAAALRAGVKKVVCRTLLNASSGAGIVIASRPEELVPAPLYTEYVPKKKEYRIHVLHGHVLWQVKKRRIDALEGRDTHIRNLANGYVYSSNVAELPHKVAELGAKLVEYGNGAYDVIYNQRRDLALVLERNSSPGLCESTANWYAEVLLAVHGGEPN